MHLVCRAGLGGHFDEPVLEGTGGGAQREGTGVNHVVAGAQGQGVIKGGNK